MSLAGSSATQLTGRIESILCKHSDLVFSLINFPIQRLSLLFFLSNHRIYVNFRLVAVVVVGVVAFVAVVFSSHTCLDVKLFVNKVIVS